MSLLGHGVAGRPPARARARQTPAVDTGREGGAHGCRWGRVVDGDPAGRERTGTVGAARVAHDREGRSGQPRVT
ncbi:hypothetical protein FTX61_04475 [Nitriliruptoraceae bacterium ZYF776]|nr:hypothetical protein [Profundirhabdus halotolerans]